MTERIGIMTERVVSQRASYQIYKIVGCACAGNAWNVFPATDFKGNRELAIHARAVILVGIAYPPWATARIITMSLFSLKHLNV